MEQVDRQDIQGIVARAYLERKFACYVMLTINAGAEAGARAALRQIAQWVASAEQGAGAEARAPVVAMAFTHAGLTKLRLPPETLAEFVPEFRQSMPARARMLGDVGDNAPANWRWGSTPESVDVLLAVYGQSPREISDWVDTQVAGANGALGEAYRLNAAFRPQPDDPRDLREPFGFRDGISQPYVEAFQRHPPGDVAKSNTVRAGEFVLGYPNQLGRLSLSPTLSRELDPNDRFRELANGRRDFGRNGTYLVARELEQDVTAFRGLPSEVQAKIMGRWPSGAPLTLAPHRDEPALGDKNDFGFAENDRTGLRCPIAAHIRRANPRDGLADPALPLTAEESLASVNLHRLLRRGRPFFDGNREGMFFICLNANIERQFEFVQQGWLRSPTFMGLNGDRDFAIGEKTTFTIPHCAGREKITLSKCVSVRGGGYFFLPGLRALNWLLNS